MCSTLILLRKYMKGCLEPKVNHIKKWNKASKHSLEDIRCNWSFVLLLFPHRDSQSCCPESMTTTTTTAHKQPSSTSPSRSQLQIQLQLRGCCPKSQGRNQGGNLSKTGRRTRGESYRGDRGPDNSRGTVTVPKPFRMMMREEEKKRRKVRRFCLVVLFPKESWMNNVT